ncbi:MAG: NACHT domain-containing protein [Mycobacterium sp.]|uniref:NACHT domain-containing protein n=1 Tax=Mycobacterium sp. TaxID=1785 RepID=UPI003F97E389
MVTLAALGTVFAHPAVHEAATSAAAKASGVLVGQIGQQFNSVQARKELAEAFTAALALAAYDARNHHRDTGGENRQDGGWKRLRKRALALIKRKKFAPNEAQTEWWDRHGKAIFVPFEDRALAVAVSRCAIGTVDPEAIRRLLTEAITTRRRHGLRRTPSYTDLADFGNKHGIDADYFCKILPGCVVDAVVATAAVPGSHLESQGILAQLTKVIQLANLPVPELNPQQVRDQLAEWCNRESARHQHNMRRLPYLTGRGDPTTINVEASVWVGPRGEAQSTDDPYLPAAARVRASQNLTTYDNVVSRHPRVIVLGDPGAGKSWALQMHAIRLANAAADQLKNAVDPKDVDVPIAVRCDALAGRRGDLGEAAVAELANLDIAMTLSLRKWLQTRCRSGKVTFLLDAFNETPAELRTAVSEMIDRPTNQAARIVVTCRLASYNMVILSSGQLCEVEMRPFDHPEDYVAALDLPDERKDKLTRLLRNRALGGMARIPLLLALLCHLASDPTEDLPRTRVDIYRRVLRRFLSGEQTPGGAFWGASLPADPNQRVDTLLGILRPLAYRIAVSEKGWQDSIPDDTMTGHLEAIQLPKGVGSADASAVLTSVGVLVRAGDVRWGRTPDYLFVHRTFAEYLVAQYLRMPDKPVDECLTSHLHLEPDWYQVWILLASLEPTLILPKLVAQQQDPLHVALSIAAAAIFELDPKTRAQPEVSRSVDGLIDKCLRLINPPVDRAVRTVAIDALGLIGGEKAINALRGLLTGPDGQAAAFALAGSADRAGPAALRNFLTDDFAIGGDAQQDPSQQDFLASAQRYRVRYMVALVLSVLGDPDSIEVLCNIVTNPHEDPAIRLMAARELRYCGPRAIDPLSTVVDQEGDVPSQLREDAIRSIAAIGGPDAEEILRRQHADADAETTAATAAAESYSEPEPANPHESADISEAPPDTSPDQSPALVELLRLKTEQLHTQLRDPDTLTRGVAAIQLANSGDTAAIAVLCEALGHEHAEFGKQLARALGRLGRSAGQEAAEALIRALDDSDAHVTFLDEVVQALTQVDDNALTDWVITRTSEGLNANQIGPIYRHFRNKSCPRASRPQLLSALAEVTSRAERGQAPAP